MITSDLVKPDNIRFFVGYSGWSTGQLDKELELGSWVISEMFANYLFNNKSDSLWQEVMKNKGDRYEVIADMSDVVNLN